MVGSQHLTGENLNHLVTLPGQAHFAIVDSKNTCRECLHWLSKGERDPKGNLKPARCQKALTFLKDPPPVSHRAYAGRHCDAAPSPPSI